MKRNQNQWNKFMSVTKSDVEHIAKLAKLEIREDEINEESYSMGKDEGYDEGKEGAESKLGEFRDKLHSMLENEVKVMRLDIDKIIEVFQEKVVDEAHDIERDLE